MSQLNAIQLAESIRCRLVDFNADTHFVRDAGIASICREIWSGRAEDGGLVGDIWVESAFPALSGQDALNELSTRGAIDKSLVAHLDTTGDCPADRPLYRHQRDALLQSAPLADNRRPGLIITAGTGAGKTESFLLPTLQALWGTPRRSRGGIRALILYPMNALVNDQVDRLYGWLKGQERLSLFHFTSETPNDDDAANKHGIQRGIYEPCRMRTRQEARGLENRRGEKIPAARRGPAPDILITNYSMLEYMLCRPQDACLFGEDLQAVVLDEAHLYTGTLAAEITLLLRRLYDRCGVSSEKVLQIATSATIGSGQDLHDFAAKIFSKPTELIRVVEGEPMIPHHPVSSVLAEPPTAATLLSPDWSLEATIEQSAEGEPQLRVAPERCTKLAGMLKALVAPETVESAVEAAKGQPARLLHGVLPYAAPIQRGIRALVERRRMPLRELAEAIWEQSGPEAERATVVLLQLGASGRAHPKGYPVWPHRLHVVARSSEGLTLCVDPDCTGKPERKLAGFGTLHAGYHERCPACEAAAVSVLRCMTCGEALVGVPELKAVMPVIPHADAVAQSAYLTARPQPGLSPRRALRNGQWELNADEQAGALWPVQACPNCESALAESAAQLVSNAVALPLSIIAETALAELPPYAGTVHVPRPAEGRRLLAFSDSRHQAASLGPRLTRQHEVQVIRAAIARMLGASHVVDAEVLADLRAEVTAAEARLKAPDLTEAQRNQRRARLEDARKELAEADSGGAMVAWIDRLADNPILAQILSAEAGEVHESGRWANEVWERNRLAVARRAVTLLASELASPRYPNPTLESLGLAEVTYPGLDDLQPPDGLLGLMPTSDLRDALRRIWPRLLASLCDTLRVDGVITLGTRDDDDAYNDGRFLLGKWSSARDANGGRLVRFTGTAQSQRRRWFVTIVLERLGISESDAVALGEKVLDAAFEQLRQEAGIRLAWLEADDITTGDKGKVPAIRLRFRELGLRRPQAHYRCARQGTIWPRELAGCGPVEGCVALESVGSDALDADPRFGRQRRELLESPVFEMGLWGEEHSAQLSPKENRRRQELFKVGLRNILSATTTMEVGIDIGGLNAVLLGNVPPGTANYLQRAGRAGRRADGSSAVITYARPRAFDRAVLLNFGKYLDKPLRAPSVLLSRDKIVLRHINAFFLGTFFRDVFGPDRETGAMDSFGRSSSFCGVPIPTKWGAGEEKPALVPPRLDAERLTQQPWHNPDNISTGLGSHFVDFLTWVEGNGAPLYAASLLALTEGTALRIWVEQDWTTLIHEIKDSFKNGFERWITEYQTLLETWKATESRAQAGALRYQMKTLGRTTVIEMLGDQQFLPRYGFPIGVMKLRVHGQEDSNHFGREEDQFRLERRGLQALQEYVPGTSLLVGGKKVTSRGLLKHWTGANLDESLGLTGRFAECQNGHFYYEVASELQRCPSCGAGPGSDGIRKLLLPTHGFSSAAWDKPRYSTEVERVGQVLRGTVSFAGRNAEKVMPEPEFAGIAGLTCWYREDGEILVYNPGERGKGFAICLSCGYADSEKKDGKGNVDLPEGFKSHARLDDSKGKNQCARREEDLNTMRNQFLAARETTDVLMLDFSETLFNRADKALGETLAQALLIAGADLLQLDSRELGMMLVPAGDGGAGLGLAFYDNLPGGAWHVRALKEQGREWLEKARQVLYVDEAHHARCHTMCLDCILNFEAQDQAYSTRLTRRDAINYLDAILSQGRLEKSQGAMAGNEVPTSPANERLARMQARMARRNPL